MYPNYKLREIILKYHRRDVLTAEEHEILEAEKARLPSDKVWARIQEHLINWHKSDAAKPWYILWPVKIFRIIRKLWK
jgi:hypothetical protein